MKKYKNETELLYSRTCFNVEGWYGKCSKCLIFEVKMMLRWTENDVN